jgi:hypothetical protein
MERLALRKPRRRAARRYRRVHCLRQVVPHAHDLQCDPRRKTRRRHRAVRDAAALDERPRPFSHDGEEHPAKQEIWQSAALRWLIDSLALAGAGMAGVYVSDLLDPPNVSGNQTRKKDWPDSRV